MIPPTASLVKYDNPVLVSRNTDKKSPRVSQDFAGFVTKSVTRLLESAPFTIKAQLAVAIFSKSLSDFTAKSL